MTDVLRPCLARFKPQGKDVRRQSTQTDDHKRRFIALSALFPFLHPIFPAQKKRQGMMPWRVAPQVRLELTTLRLTAECSAIELLRIIRGLFAARCLPAARSSASSSLLLSALATASARTSLSARSALTTASASLLARLPLAAPFFLMFESGKNFRSSRSLWIPATSYSPKPFPAQYHQRLEA